MAKPIKETPVLYDEDAYRFEMAAQNVVPLSEKKREEIFRATTKKFVVGVLLMYYEP